MDSFDVGIKHAATEKMEMREWHKSTLLHSVPWLKRMNARGYDVYIRPRGEHGLVLVGGLTQQKIATLNVNGFAPAATVETHKGSYQAWFKLSEQPVSARIRELTADGIATNFGGKSAQMEGGPFGRLAGFANQDARHRIDGKQPFVLAHGSPGKVAREAPAYLGKVERALREEAMQLQRARETKLEQEIKHTMRHRPGGRGLSR